MKNGATFKTEPVEALEVWAIQYFNVVTPKEVIRFEWRIKTEGGQIPEALKPEDSKFSVSMTGIGVWEGKKWKFPYLVVIDAVILSDALKAFPAANDLEAMAAWDRTERELELKKSQAIQEELLNKQAHAGKSKILTL